MSSTSDGMTKSERRDYEKIRDILGEILDMNPQNPDYIFKLKEAREMLSAHIQELKEKQMEALEEAMTTFGAGGTSEELIEAFIRVSLL